MANTEQAKQMAEYRRQLRLNTLQNLKNGGASQGVQTNVTPPQQTTNFVGDIAKTVSNFGESLNETGLDIVGHVSKGLFKGLEGIYDAGAGLVGTVGGWFSENFEEKVKNHIAIDGSENVFGWLYEATDDSYINKMGEKGQNITRGVAQGIGQMLPSIIVTVVTHGAGASTMASQIAGMGTFAAGATGGATEEAVQGGADLGQAMGYGIASGALETAIEKASGNVPWDDIAKGAIKGAGKSALSKATSTFFSEGVEEVASDVLNPALKRVTGVDREATIDYSKLPETFAIGGLTGVTMGGASRGITNLKYNKAGGSKFVSMAEELDSIRENEVKLAEFQENKKHTAEQVEDYAKRVDTDNYESIQRISETLKSLPANKRGNAFFTAPDLHNIFEANGEIKADIQNNFKDVSNMNVSAGIRHQTSKLNEVLKGVNERHNTNFELDTDKLNDTERTTLAKVTSAVSRLAKSSKYKAYAGLDVAIIKNAKNENAFIKDGVIYLSREHLSSGEWAKHVAHEVTHFTEGSKEYNAFAKFLTEDAQAVNRASEAISKQGYGYTAEQVKDALAKVNRGEALTENEQEAYSELISHIAEEILGNEDSINRLTEKNKSLANRIYERIKSFIKAFTGTNADKETVAKLRKAEKLFAKALENTGKAQAEAVKKAQEELKTLDNNPEFAYSKKYSSVHNSISVTEKDYQDIESDVMSWYMNYPKGEVLTHFKNGYFYSFIVNNDVDSKGYLFTILSKSGSKNINEKEGYYAKHNGETVNTVVKGIRSEQESGNVGFLSSERRRTEGINRETNSRVGEREKEFYGQQDSQDGTPSSRTNVKFSFKDKEYMQAVKENDIETAQKLVDEAAKIAGYTIKAYHGTLAKDFTEFKKSFIGSRFSFDEKGFFFIDRKSIADDYAHSEFDSFKKGRIIETYLKVQNPLYVDSKYALREGLGKVFRDDDAIGVWDNYNAFLLEEAETKNADGIIVDDGMSKMIVVFDSNQIKSSEAITYDNQGDVIPISKRFNKSNNDIRFSRKDSQGNELTEAQAEYFKDSKVRDEYGNLLVVYHGSGNQFNEFLHRYMGLNGNAHGRGFYFTEDKSYAEGYKKENGQLLEGYLNISKPVSETKVTISKSNLVKLIKATCEYSAKEWVDDGEYDNVKDALLDTWVSNYVNTYDIYDMNSVYRQVADIIYKDNNNDVDILAELTNAGAGLKTTLSLARKTLGYDGIIFDNGNGTHQFVSFESNQFKNISNKAPTSSSDIRFSRKPFAEQVDDVLNGADTVSTHLQVRETTPQIFLDIGLENKPMLITSTHTKTAVNKKVPNKNIHALSRETLKKLPELLENPAIVMDSTKEGSIVAFVNAVDEDNNPVLCAIKINGTGNYNNLEISSNIVTSVYGKDANPVGFIEKAVNEDRLLYWDKKMSQELFETPGLQLPDNLNNFDSNVIIRKSKYIVNTFNEDSQEKFSRKAQTSTEATEFLTEIPKKDITLKERANDMLTNFSIHFTDAQAGIVKEGKRLGVEDIEAIVQSARASYSAGANILENGFFDIEKKEKIGKGFNEIWDSVYKKGDEYRVDFYEYLFNWSHIDRLKVDKGILNDVTEEQAKERIAQLEAQHPEFKALAKDVWDYLKNLLQVRVNNGNITQAEANNLNAIYPHYVPAFTENGQGSVGVTGKPYNVAVKETIKRAKGSVANKLPPDVIIARQTMEVMRAGKVNKLAKALYDATVNKNDTTNVKVVKIDQRWQPNQTKESVKEAKERADELLEALDNDYTQEKDKDGQITFYDGDKKITMEVTKEIFEGFKSFAPNDDYRNSLIEGIAKVNAGFKKLVTSWNPFFALIRNPFRDLQEALFYTKNGMGRFIGHIPTAYRLIKSNSAYWQEFLAMGGRSSSLYDYNTGVKRYKGAKAIVYKVLDKLTSISDFLETFPRFNEYVLSRKRGASAEQALLDSADVTTNFSRGGKTAMLLNRTFMPFLNPSIQGWSKLYRTVMGRKTAKEWMRLILYSLMLGILPTALNDLLMGDDEEYESLNIRDKENYYLLKVGDTFWKLPKGRVLSVLGSLYIRAKEMAKGNENAWDGYLQSAASAVSPVDSFTRTIFSPITDAKTNTTWYGGQIEGRKFENVAVTERYDESTSKIAVVIGKVIGKSPKKVHYVIDQYSGFIGDVLLPLTTPKAERGAFAYNFTIDSTMSNRYSNDFYTALDEANYAKSAGDINANYVVRYLNSISTEVSDMYAQQHKIQSSNKSNKDKTEEVKVIQMLINATNKSALENVKVLKTTLTEMDVTKQNELLVSNNKFLKLDENAQKRAIQKLNDYYYALAMNKAFGIELEEKYTKYSKFNSPELFVYLTEIGSIEGDKDKQGNTISGSRKANILKYLKSKGITSAKQDIILDILGYSTTTK